VLDTGIHSPCKWLQYDVTIAAFEVLAHRCAIGASLESPSYRSLSQTQSPGDFAKADALVPKFFDLRWIEDFSRSATTSHRVAG